MHFKLPVPNRILVNHVIQSAQVKSEIECETNCFAHDDCMSVNLAPLQDGNYLCELSNSDHDIHPEDFKQMNRALFKPVKVSLVWSLPKLNVCVKAGFFILMNTRHGGLLKTFLQIIVLQVLFTEKIGAKCLGATVRRSCLRDGYVRSDTHAPSSR